MLDVVALALISSSGRILLQRRPTERQHGGLWEFPGGKLERGETAIAGLLREIEEELGLRLAEADVHWLTRAQDPAGQIVIRLYTCRHWSGEPECLDAAELGWFMPEALDALPMPPLDRPLAQVLQALLQSEI